MTTKPPSAPCATRWAEASLRFYRHPRIARRCPEHGALVDCRNGRKALDYSLRSPLRGRPSVVLRAPRLSRLRGNDEDGIDQPGWREAARADAFRSRCMVEAAVTVGSKRLLRKVSPRMGVLILPTTKRWTLVCSGSKPRSWTNAQAKPAAPMLAHRGRGRPGEDETRGGGETPLAAWVVHRAGRLPASFAGRVSGASAGCSTVDIHGRSTD